MSLQSGVFCYTVFAHGVAISLARIVELVGSYLIAGNPPLPRQDRNQLLKVCEILQTETEAVLIDKSPPGTIHLLDLFSHLVEESSRKEGLPLTVHYAHKGWLTGAFVVLRDHQVLIENNIVSGFTFEEEAEAPEEKLFLFSKWAGKVLGSHIAFGVYVYQE